MMEEKSLKSNNKTVIQSTNNDIDSFFHAFDDSMQGNLPTNMSSEFSDLHNKSSSILSVAESQKKNQPTRLSASTKMNKQFQTLDSSKKQRDFASEILVHLPSVN